MEHWNYPNSVNLLITGSDMETATEEGINVVYYYAILRIIMITVRLQW